METDIFHETCHVAWIDDYFTALVLLQRNNHNIAKREKITYNTNKKEELLMLVRFSVENFLSYKEQQVFSMVAGKQTKHKDHIFEVKGKRLLKSSFFFGANAAGKSNLFKAIRFAQNIIINGIKKNTLTNMHFRIDSSYAERPGVFQFDIYSHNNFYSYGFSISYKKAAIEEEWLYLCGSSDVAIFERKNIEGKNEIKTDWEFVDENQKQNFMVFSENVPDDKTLLLEISERKLIEFDDFEAYRVVMQWVKDLLVILPVSRYKDKINLVNNDNQFDLGKLLNSFDTGIEKITIGEKKIEDFLDFLPENIKNDLIKKIEDELNNLNSENKFIELEFSGQFFRFTKKDNQIIATQLLMNHGNDKDPFELSDESDGTQRLFDLVPVLRTDNMGKVIFVDELDRSFHTKLVQQFIQLYYEKTIGVESQLIATVHDSNIMDLNLLRQDEIWFVERKDDHCTHIYSLNKFQERFDKKIEKDYLLGRYGAIPCFTQIETISMEV